MRKRTKCVIGGSVLAVVVVVGLAIMLVLHFCYYKEVNGGWSDYSDKTNCTKSCGQGTKTRERFCTNPSPARGGTNCTGLPTEISFCNSHPCPVHGNWTTHSNWTECSATCGGGTKLRWRSCSNPSPAHGGDRCTGQPTEIVACNTQGCLVDGGWSPFHNWTECNVSCGGGVKFRQRTCTNPPPANGGKTCSGAATETLRCMEQTCTNDVHATQSLSDIEWAVIFIGIGVVVVVVVAVFLVVRAVVLRRKRKMAKPSAYFNNKVPQQNGSSQDVFQNKTKA